MNEPLFSTGGNARLAPVLRYPQDIGKPPFDKYVLFSVKSGRHVVRDRIVEVNGPDRTIATCALYLSETVLRDDLTVHYDTQALGVLPGLAVELLAQWATNAGNITFDQMKEMNLDKLVTKFKDAKGDVTEFLGKISGTDVGNAVVEYLKADAYNLVNNLANARVVDAALGQRPNPRTDTIFDTQNFREHRYEFTMVPRSEQEAQAIDKIVNMFQFYMLPTYRRGNLEKQAKIGAFMIGFPYEWEVELRTAPANNKPGGRMEHVNQPGRCVLKQVSIDHAAGGKTAFVKSDNGDLYPVATKISLHFQEVRLLARDSVEIQRPGGPKPLGNEFEALEARPRGGDIWDDPNG